MITLQNGQQRRIDFSNMDISGIKLKGLLFRTTAWTEALSGANVAWDKIMVDLNLFQANKKVNMYSGTLKALLTLVLINRSDYNLLDAPVLLDGDAPTGATGTDFEGVLPTEIDFGQVLNLRGNDKLTLDIKLQSDAINAFYASSSYLGIEEITAVGLQYHIPVFTVLSIQANEQTPKFALGDNVLRTVFINTEESVPNKTNKIIETVAIYSDRLNTKMEFEDLIYDRIKDFETVAEADKRKSTFVLTEGELDNLRIEITTVPAKVTASKNFLGVISYLSDGGIVREAERRNAKHRQYLRNKIR